jgi:hypothetical protein
MGNPELEPGVGDSFQCMTIGRIFITLLVHFMLHCFHVQMHVEYVDAK